MPHQTEQLRKISALILALAVGLGAFGAHGLKPHLAPEDMEVFKTANFYHFIHGIALLLLAALAKSMHRKHVKVTSILFLVGIALFSGSLYLLSISETLFGERITWLGMITPLGGVGFILGWLFFAFSSHKKGHYSKKEES
ncbi:MAG: DUF423 domain-containing protein [Bacteroidetes bacterium]|nr:MAG: DUF423 domain-containing protein [Bacteroidota bacterium]